MNSINFKELVTLVWKLANLKSVGQARKLENLRQELSPPSKGGISSVWKPQFCS